MNSIVERLREARRTHAITAVSLALHTEAADLIEQQAAILEERNDLIEQQAERIKELEAELESRKSTNAGWNAYHALCKRIADAPVVAWLHEVRRDSDVITDQVKHLWGMVPVAVGKEARYTIPLISKENLQK